jgi:DNA-binding NtrC family response regulator
LVEYGYEVIESPDKTGSLRDVQTRRPDLIILSSRQDQAFDGFELTRQIRRLDRRLPIIMITHTDELILAALRAGVKDCVKPGFSIGELLASVQRCLKNRLTRKLSESELAASVDRSGDWMIGSSAAIGKVKAFIQKIAWTNSEVLVTGETGTGKELVAELIHLTSPRRKKPMVSIHCAAISDKLLANELFGSENGSFTGVHFSGEGKMKLVEGGTVFFDEIVDMGPCVQSKIIRVIKNRSVKELRGRRGVSLDIRIIAATSQDMEAGVRDGKICEDLYETLGVARIDLPPLRERGEDIPALLEHYLGIFNQQFGRQVEGFDDGVLEDLIRYDWPGNIRELRNLLEAVVSGSPSRIISASDLPLQHRNKFESTR